MELLRRLPIWGWVILVLIIVFLVWAVGSNFQKRSLFNLIKDQLKDDKAKVIEALETNLRGYEEEIIRLQSELDRIRRLQASVKAENESLKRKIDELQKKRQEVFVPADPGHVVDEFRQLGYGSGRLSSPCK